MTTLSDVQKGMSKFMVRMFVFGFILGVGGAALYAHFGSSTDRFFHCFIIFAGLAFTFPMFTISIRLMLKMYYMSVEATEKQSEVIEKFHRVEKEAGPVIDKVKEILTVHADPAILKIEKVIEKSIPIAENMGVILEKAKGMTEDIERIAHRIRSATDAMNGHFDFKSLESRLDKVADSLSTIASVFDPPKKKASNQASTEVSEKAVVLPMFDPLVAGRRK